MFFDNINGGFIIFIGIGSKEIEIEEAIMKKSRYSKDTNILDYNTLLKKYNVKAYKTSP